MRKCLGALAVCAALSTTMWAQDPAPTAPPTAPPTETPAPSSPTTPSNQTPNQTPTEAQPTQESTSVHTKAPVVAAQFPRFELFGGGTYGETGFFNAGHWAGLKGWDASVAFNATGWLGFVVDGGQYFGTSKIPVAVPAPFPTCPPLCPTTFPTFDVKTKAYDFLFGAQFSRRKYERFTPFGELMFGRAGVRGDALAQGFGFRSVTSGTAILAGGGADYKINRRFALRLKADYIESKNYKRKQDNFRFSVGVVIRSVPKKKRTLEEDTVTQ